MSSDMSDSPGRRPASLLGRRRDGERTDAILHAAGDLLFERGVDRFSVQDVATRAGSGKGAIYRRWETKEALVAEAIRNMPQAEFPHTEDAVSDLRATIELRFAALNKQPDLLPSLLTAMRDDEGIAAAVDDSYTVTPIRDAIARIIGHDHPHLDLLTELAPALAIHRATMGKHSYGHRSVSDDVQTIINLIAPAT